ncbi:MAG: GntR domain protein [Conexibacter sp.]|nr:GntR domain protein [Conexibacter sp.]
MTRPISQQSTPTPAPLRRHSLVEQAIDALRTQIASGAWPVGERIPTEPALVATFGIGRNSLREATRALVHAGLLETRQGDGTYVRATSELAGALRRRASRAELVEIFEVRRGLEIEAARLAAERRSDADLARLEQIAAARATAWEAGHVEAFVAADIALHQAIAAAAGNTMLAELYDDFSDALRAAIHGTLGDATVAAPEDPLHLHDDLLTAIRRGDPIAAQDATAAYLDAMLAALHALVAR